jgi:hypothetical protein
MKRIIRVSTSIIIIITISFIFIVDIVNVQAQENGQQRSVRCAREWTAERMYSSFA